MRGGGGADVTDELGLLQLFVRKEVINKAKSRRSAVEDELSPPCSTAHTGETTPGSGGRAALTHSRGHLLLRYASVGELCRL